MYNILEQAIIDAKALREAALKNAEKFAIFLQRAGLDGIGEERRCRVMQTEQVGCEVCHGPGNKHAANPSPGNIIRKPPETTCRRCHTPARDETFSYDDDIQFITCPPDAE